jgi:uncharacterized protein
LSGDYCNFLLERLGLGIPASWILTLAFAVAWLLVMLAYSPVADTLATRLVAKPPTLGAFRSLQQSRSKLLIGIVIAWIFGGFLEEVIFRGFVQRALETWLSLHLFEHLAIGVAICAAALAAGVVHLYQGLRAAVIIAQLSALFGVLFVISEHDLWAVVLCHGFYDTIAFIRFANGKSKYAQFADETHVT